MQLPIHKHKDINTLLFLSSAPFSNATSSLVKQFWSPYCSELEVGKTKCCIESCPFLYPSSFPLSLLLLPSLHFHPLPLCPFPVPRSPPQIQHCSFQIIRQRNSAIISITYITAFKRIVIRIGSATYRYGILQKRSGRMVLSWSRKCQCGIPSHTAPLPALIQ